MPCTVLIGEDRPSLLRGDLARQWSAYLLALAGTIAAVALSDALSSGLERVPFVFCYVAVALSALYGGLGPALLSTLVGIIGVSYLILPPIHGLRFERPADILSVIAFTVVAVAISSLTQSLHRAVRALEDSRRRARPPSPPARPSRAFWEW
jgi:two-component system, OmpR family, sensor histidine kinase KdpD